MKCVRCGVTEKRHASAPCPRFEAPAPRWMRELTTTIDKLLR